MEPCQAKVLINESVKIISFDNLVPLKLGEALAFVASGYFDVNDRRKRIKKYVF